jgi:hypothetical protein
MKCSDFACVLFFLNPYRGEEDMSSRLKTGFSRPSSKAFQNGELLNFDVASSQRILLVLAPLFFVISADYLKTERLNRWGDHC